MNELYRYLALAVTSEWRRLPADTREAHPPSQFECMFVSLAHDEAAVDAVVAAARAAFAEL